MGRLLPLLLLAGCGGLPPGTPSMYLGHDCAGREVNISFTEYTSNVPGVDCLTVADAYGVDERAIALMVALWPVFACASVTEKGNFVVLPPWASDAMRNHEYEHLTGHKHAPGLPFYVGSGC